MTEVNLNKAFTPTLPLYVMGIFVWGDAVMIGFFGSMLALVTLVVADWYLFLLGIMVFWLVRSAGETIYWLNQQFSTLRRNPPEDLRGFGLSKDESLWFIYQTAWQCLTVVFAILSVYLGWIWLRLG